ncbi:MAG: carbohydrate kinase family protein [Fibrella sp.]|nr:carbohydrate kinase family protein [Armatimonadota bacterium]
MIEPGRVIVYGTVCLDRFFLPGQSEAEATEFPGGEAFNTATALAGWGVPVTLTGTAIGDDAEGLRLRELLRNHPLAQGIDLSLVPFVSGAVTPVCTVRVDEDGERFMSGRGFREVTPPELETILPRFAERPLFTVDPNLGNAAIEATLAAAKAGCPVVSMDCADIPEVLAVSDVAVTSREWITRAGRDKGIELAAKRIIDAGARTAIITLGAEGGISLTKHKYSNIPGLRRGDVFYTYTAALLSSAQPVVDTTGAGDTFRAGLCLRLAMGGNLPSTLRFASASAALHCTIVGGGSRFPHEAVRNLATKVRVKLLPVSQSNT